MRSKLSILFVVLLTFAGVISPLSAQTVTDEEVAAAIKEMKRRIFEAQQGDGIWEDFSKKKTNDKGKVSGHGIQWGGTTALATYALLQAGESFQHPGLVKALQFLSSTRLEGTYAIALRAQMWGILPDTYDQSFARDVKWLIDAKRPGPEGGYVYSYDMPKGTVKPSRGGYSNSRTKFGLLGLWEGAKRGHKVPSEIWKGVEEHYVNTQLDNGGWGYSLSDFNPQARGSMTAAGLIALHAIEDYYHRKDYRTPGVRLPIQDSIDKGLDWFHKHFKANAIPNVGGPKKGGYRNLFYYLYAMERVGLASGVKYFNGKPWFESGARVIVDELADPKGAFAGKKANNVISLSFALIFLARGSNPVLVNKLELPNVAWNNRPSDMTQLTKWMSDNMETPVIWQRIPINTNPITWRDAPILYLASHQPINLSDADKSKIKNYIDAGGILITSSDNKSTSFSTSIKKIMADIYPNYEYQPMTVEDPVFSAIHQFEKMPTEIEVLNNGVRHLAMHFPNDLSWTFHSEDRKNLNTWKMFVNVVYYATGGWPRSRRSVRDEKVELTGKTVPVGRLKYDGNYDPEPGAWRKQNRLMGNKVQAKLKFLDFNQLPNATEKFVHMTGTDAFEIKQEQLNKIYDYAEGGGTILIENASGDAQFTESMLAAMNQSSRNKPFFPVDTFAPIVTGEGYNGFDLSVARYRKFSVVFMGRASKRIRLQEMVFDSGGRILLSPEDLTSGMLGAPAWGINGYSPDTSRKLMVNMMLSAIGAKAAPKKQGQSGQKAGGNKGAGNKTGGNKAGGNKAGGNKAGQKKNAGGNKKNAGGKNKKNAGKKNAGAKKKN